MTRVRVIVGAAAVLVAAVAAGCSGILGLDETTLRSSDASSDGVSPGDGGSQDGDATAPDAPPGEGGGGDSGAPVFTTMPPNVVLYPDASVGVKVSVQRNNLQGALTIGFTQLPMGVTSNNGLMAADASATTVVMSAAASAMPSMSNASLQANGTTYASVPVAVYGSPGSIDSSFQGGYALDKTDPTSSMFNAVAIDAMGRIVAGGTKGTNGWLLRRFASDGSADTAFDMNADGAMPASGSLNGLAIDPVTNVIVCVGAAGSQLTVAVVDPSGHLSGPFNGGSTFALTPVQAQNSAGYGVTIDAMKRFTIAGQYQQGTASAFLTVPIAETATPDPSNVSAYFGPASTMFAASALDSAGAIVAAGSDTSGMPTIFAARFVNGALDGAFGMGGTSTSGSFCEALTVVARPSSRSVFAAGYDINDDYGCFAQWDKAGQLSYTKEGSQGGGGAYRYAGTAPMGDAQDHIYMVGSGGDMFARSAELDRVAMDGSYDPTFGTGGQVKMGDPNTMPTYWYTLKAVAVQPNGLVVIGGSKTDMTGTWAVLGRFYP